MLCDICNKIDLIKASNRHKRRLSLHHKSYAEIRQFAASGCQLCQMIVADLSQNDSYAEVDWDKVEKGMEDTQVEYFVSRFNDLGGSNEGPWSTIQFMHVRPGLSMPYLYVSLRIFAHHSTIKHKSLLDLTH